VTYHSVHPEETKSMDLKRMGSLVEYFRMELIGELLWIRIIYIKSAEFLNKLKGNSLLTIF
jgi:hypothetical protein